MQPGTCVFWPRDAKVAAAQTRPEHLRRHGRGTRETYAITTSLTSAITSSITIVTNPATAKNFACFDSTNKCNKTVIEDLVGCSEVEHLAR
ncbi:MAG: hypothetical protein ABR530_04780, partial [Pyrinomonadaceae bacterium]